MPILFRWLSRWPLWLLHGLGSALGGLAYALSPTYRRRFVANVRQAGLTSRDVRPAIAEAGRLIAEAPWVWMRPPSEALLTRVEWDGEAAIAEAHRDGRGVVFLTPHLGSFEVLAQAYAERYGAHQPVTVLYRPARKVWLRALVDESRERAGLSAVPATLAGVRQMIRALRRGEAVGLLPDQVPPDGLGVWAPFFGQPAYTMTLAARLVQQTGAMLLLAWGERRAASASFVLHFSRFDETLPPGPAESAAAINRAMERLILQCPQQYLWGYARYKSPRREPAGAAGERRAAQRHR